jgi:hypothetical protein
VNNQPSGIDRSLTRTAIAALIGVLLLLGQAAQGAASSEPLLPVIDDGGPGGIPVREFVDDGWPCQTIESHQGSQPTETEAQAADEKAMLPHARTESMSMHGSLTSAKHADEEAYCFFCFSYR